MSRGELDTALKELYPEARDGQIVVERENEDLGFDPVVQSFVVGVASSFVANAITAAVRRRKGAGGEPPAPETPGGSGATK